MSETITLVNATAIIYGSLAGARAYLGALFDAWDVVDDSDVTTDMRRALVRAGRYLDRLPWGVAYVDFAVRDGLDLGTGDGDAAFPFRAASYLLANATYEGGIEFGVSSSSTDIASMSAGGASITYRNESASTSVLDALPADVLALIGPYLADGVIAASVGAEGGTSATGTCVNPFGPRRDFDRNEPW